MNILILESLFHQGGIENLLFDILVGLKKRNHEIIICTLYEPGPMAEPFIKEGFIFYSNLMKNKFDIGGIFKINSIIKKHRIELLYLVTQPLTIFYGYLSTKISKIPMVCLIGNTIKIEEHIKLNIYRWLIPKANMIITQAKMQKDHMQRTFNISEEKLTVIQNGIKPIDYKNISSRKKVLESLNIKNDRLIVGFIGRINKIKGVDILLYAAESVLKEFNKVEFIIIGQGPAFEEIDSLRNQLRITKNVHLLGFCKEKMPIINTFDIAVLPSRTEASPIVILEYMAMGKAIIATNVGSVPELINMNNGIIINPEDPKKLYSNIVYLLRDQEKREELGNNAKLDFEREYDINNTILNTEEALKAVIHSN